MSKTKIKKLGRRGKIGLAVLVAVMFIGVASAALIPHFGVIKTTATVDEQAVEIGVEQSDTIVWHSYNDPITHTIADTSPGGETFCFKQWIRNNAPVPVDVTFDNNDPAGITTTYYKLTEQEYIIEEGREGYGGDPVDLDDPNDAYNTLGNINLKISYEGAKVVFTITTPEGLIGSTPETYSGSVVFILDEDADGTTDWQISYEPGSLYPGHETPCDWGYEEALENGANPEPRAFVDATTISGIEVERDGDNFIVRVDFEKLGGLGSEYKFGFYISHRTEYWGGIEGGADQVTIFFPYFDEGFDWADTSGYETRTIGTEMTSLTLQSGQQLPFYICHAFDLHIGKATYYLTTIVDAEEHS